MTKTMPKEPQQLRATVSGRPIGVDREAKILRGYVVAQRGHFKSAGRGQFDDESLAKIVELINARPDGVKSRFTHPTLSDDGLGKLLGRAKAAFLDVDRVRADLHFAETAFNTPNGNLAGYVMDLADEDPDATSSSLVLLTEKIYVLDENGRTKKGEDGQDLPPIWRPKKILASDIVDTGDAVDGLLGASLSADGLPDEVVRRGCELLEQQFAGQPADVVRARCLAWLDRYLAWKFDATSDEQRGPGTEFYRRRLRLKELRDVHGE